MVVIIAETNPIIVVAVVDQSYSNLEVFAADSFTGKSYCQSDSFTRSSAMFARITAIKGSSFS